MSDKPGWLGRAQWMPMPVPTPEVARTARVVVVLLLLFDAAALAGGWAMAHVTSSIGWGFVTVVAAFLVGLPIYVLLARRIQARASAAVVGDSDPSDDEL